MTVHASLVAELKKHLAILKGDLTKCEHAETETILDNQYILFRAHLDKLHRTLGHIDLLRVRKMELNNANLSFEHAIRNIEKGKSPDSLV